MSPDNPLEGVCTQEPLQLFAKERNLKMVKGREAPVSQNGTVYETIVMRGNTRYEAYDDYAEWENSNWSSRFRYDL